MKISIFILQKPDKQSEGATKRGLCQQTKYIGFQNHKTVNFLMQCTPFFTILSSKCIIERKCNPKIKFATPGCER